MLPILFLCSYNTRFASGLHPFPVPLVKDQSLYWQPSQVLSSIAIVELATVNLQFTINSIASLLKILQ